MDNPFIVGDIHRTSFYPPIMNYFLEVDEQDIFNKNNKLRHPGGIFNITSLYIIKSLSQFVDTYLASDKDFDKIFNDFRLVLYDFFKFYDSCFEIMACFCKGKKPLTEKDYIDQWIKINHYTCEAEFKLALTEELKVLKNAYNKLKHTSNRIGWVIIADENSNECIGYYLEAGDDKGTAAPSDSINYPISLNKEVRSIYYLIYKVSITLQEILKVHISKWNTNISFSLSNQIIQSKEWQELFEKIERLPMLFLPNETGKEVILPVLQNDNFIFLKQKIQESFKGNLQIGNVTGGDGYTRAFAFPHMGLDLKNMDL